MQLLNDRLDFGPGLLVDLRGAIDDARDRALGYASEFCHVIDGWRLDTGIHQFIVPPAPARPRRKIQKGLCLMSLLLFLY
jgi:hypothetical protein